MSRKEEIMEKAIPMLNEGISLLQISKEITDVSYNTLSRYLRDYTVKKPRMTKEEKQLILDMFDEGYNTVEIESKTGRDNSTIGDFLKKNNRFPNAKKTSLLKKDYDEIIRMYLEEKKSTVVIGEIFDVSDRTIAKILRDNDVELRESGTIPKIINHDYFEVIDTEEKAYFLGLVISDGSIVESKTRPSRNLALALMLSEQDGYMVRNLARVLCGTDESCGYDKRKREVYFRGTSPKIAQDLSKYGIVPRKTLISYLPQISEELMPHLIRGIFDGDGTVYAQSNSVRFGFYGTELICNQIKKYLIDKIGINDNKVFVKKDCNVSFVYFSRKKDIENFYNFIYGNANIYLERKKEKFVNHANIELTV